MYDIMPGEYYADERKALLRILDESVKERDFHTKHKVDRWQIAAHGKDFVDHTKDMMVRELADIVAKELVDMDMIKFSREEEFYSGMIVLQADTKISFLKNPDRFRYHMEQAIKELTEYEDV